MKPSPAPFVATCAFASAIPSVKPPTSPLSAITSPFLKPRPANLQQKRTTRIQHSRFHQFVARGERIDPSDEAFVTCNACGADEIVSASRISSSGVLRVKCTQCNATWTAKAEDAMNVMGAPLVRQDSPRNDEGTTGHALSSTGVKLFVSGLSPRVDNGMLRDALQQFGEVRDARVVYDKVTRRSRGFGFVTMGDKSSASAAMDILSGDGSSVLGRRVKLRQAIEN